MAAENLQFSFLPKKSNYFGDGTQNEEKRNVLKLEK